MFHAAGYLRETKSLIALAALVFTAGALFGIMKPEAFGSYTGVLDEFIGRFRGKRGIVLIFMIFSQNVTSAFLAFWLGTLLCVVPLFAAFSNGVILGLVVHRAASFAVPATLLSILPHGIFELPAMHVAWALGIWRGMWVFDRERLEGYRQRAARSYGAFLAFVVPLLAVAAVIEGITISLSR